jgi:OOP family OmpA-OmpF porin
MHPGRFLPPLVALVILLAAGTPSTAAAQLGRMKDKLKKKVENKAERKVDEAMDDAVDCLFGDQECIDQAKKDGRDVVVVDKDGKPMSAEEQAAAAGGAGGGASPGKGADAAPGSGVWRNYDFVPGRTVLYASDFTGERIGRVPGDFELVSGNMQLVELDGEKVLEFSGTTIFRIQLPRPLTPGFSLEYRGRIGAGNMSINTYFSPPTTAIARYPSHYLSLFQRAGLYLKGNSVSSGAGLWKMQESLHNARFQFDGEYAIFYVEHERVGNLPKASFELTDTIEFHVTANPNHRAYLTDIVVAVGLDDLYTTLKEKGEFTTRGIYFDSGSHVIRPESTPTLEALRDALKNHADLKVIIEGHTDGQGPDADNQSLSERRAGAVRDYLVSAGIDGGRLRAAGLGETTPVADNASAAGRQENRRVVLRLDT